MGATRERRGAAEAVVTVNEAAYAAGVSVKAVNQAIDREHIRPRTFRRAADGAKRGRRGVAASDLVYLRVQEVLAPEFRTRLRHALRGRALAEIPRQVELNGVVVDLERPIREVGERLRMLERIAERIESRPDVRAGAPVFRGTRTPVHAVAHKAELGASVAELVEDHPQLDEEDVALAVRYARLHPRRGRPRGEASRGGEGGAPTP